MPMTRQQYDIHSDVRFGPLDIIDVREILR